MNALSKTIKLKTGAGDEFDAYLAAPDGGRKTGVVIASAVSGVDTDIRAYADKLAAAGHPVIAPDPFWRTDPGPSDYSEAGRARSGARAKPRVRLIELGVSDMALAMAALKAETSCNGRVAFAGFCYGGPYAIIGPARLGGAGGISYHGTKMDWWADELETVDHPVQIHWGDQDFAAPEPVLELYRDISGRKKNVALSVYPDVPHGYMAGSHPTAFRQTAYDASMADTMALLAALS